MNINWSCYSNNIKSLNQCEVNKNQSNNNKINNNQNNNNNNNNESQNCLHIKLSENSNKKLNDTKNGDNNNINNNNNNSFLNKKRKFLKSEKDYIFEIKRLMKEGGLEDKYIFIKKKKSNSDDPNNPNAVNQNKNININATILVNNNILNNKSKKVDKEIVIKPVDPIQQSKSLYEWYEKLNLLPCNNIQVNNANNSNNGNAIFNISCNIVSHKNPYDDKNEDGYVRFFGINNNIINQDNGNYKHYIYLREQNDFDPSISGKIYQWKVNILCDSYLIGVGLADKNIVLENRNKFLSNDDKFNNGVFCLINTYNKNFNVKEIRPWNCDDKNAVNYVAVFPYFKKGREVTMEYDTDNMSLEFKIKKNSYSMKNIVIKGGKNIFTPCAIFYYSGDEIQFSKLTVVNK